MLRKMMVLVLVFVFALAFTAGAQLEEQVQDTGSNCCLWKDSHGHLMFICHGCPSDSGGTDSAGWEIVGNCRISPDRTTICCRSSSGWWECSAYLN